MNLRPEETGTCGPGEASGQQQPHQTHPPQTWELQANVCWSSPKRGGPPCGLLNEKLTTASQAPSMDGVWPRHSSNDPGTWPSPSLDRSAPHSMASRMRRTKSSKHKNRSPKAYPLNEDGEDKGNKTVGRGRACSPGCVQGVRSVRMEQRTERIIVVVRSPVRKILRTHTPARTS